LKTYKKTKIRTFWDFRFKKNFKN